MIPKASEGRRGVLLPLKHVGTGPSLAELLACEEVFRTSSTPTILLQDGKLLRINGAARRLLGGTPSQVSLVELTRTRTQGFSRSRARGTITTGRGVFQAVLASSRTAAVQVWCLELLPPLNLKFPDLTSRERSVLALVVKGMTNSEIASELCVSVETVHKHVSHVLAKTGLHSRTKLAAVVLKSG